MLGFEKRKQSRRDMVEAILFQLSTLRLRFSIWPSNAKNVHASLSSSRLT